MNLRERYRFLLPNPKGSLLVVSLWMITILTIFSFTMSFHVRQKISVADRIDRRNWLYGITETGVYQSLYKIRQKKEAGEAYHTLNDTYTSQQTAFVNVPVGEDGAFTVSYPYHDTRTGKKGFHYGIEDEMGRFNINILDAKTLALFIMAVGQIEEDKANEIAYSIVDWRDQGNSMSHPEFGAEDDYYEDLDSPYGSKDHPFESLDELLLVRGMTPEIFEKLKPFITIYGTGEININTAPREVLLGLGMEESLADKVVAYRAGPDQVEGTPDDNIFTIASSIPHDMWRKIGILPADQSVLQKLVESGRINIISDVFRIRSRGEIAKKLQALEIEAVADIKGTILSWSTGFPRRMSAEELERAGQAQQMNVGE